MIGEGPGGKGSRWQGRGVTCAETSAAERSVQRPYTTQPKYRNAALEHPVPLTPGPEHCGLINFPPSPAGGTHLIRIV